ncbi:hypothetical protein [Nocardia pseudovaccinii]|uniref:hypothetical protein n=1 Tax=Nocardia pseudovaccinii TaxID=189540 RepID=UPI0007A51DBE|nr:hypothetical protein [Nocardia pseudovaccinii]
MNKPDYPQILAPALGGPATPPIGFRPFGLPPKAPDYRVLQPADYVLRDGSLPQTPMPPYRGTLLPFNFILAHGVDENDPMPRFQPEPAETGIALVASCMPRVLAHLFTRPEVVLNGQHLPQKVGWGTTFIPAEPGLHHLRVGPPPWRAPWSRFGSHPMPADIMVPVTAGHQTRVYSRASMAVSTPGRLGPQPQRWIPGIIGWLLFTSIAILAMVLGAYQVLTY